MTDILSRLAALTADRESGLWIENWHGSPTEKGSSIWAMDWHGRKTRMLFHVGETEEHHKIATAFVALHNRSIPHDAALIALVREAAGEIERLRKFVGFIRMKAEWRFQGSDYVAEEDPAYPKVSETAIAATAYLREILIIANKALNPQEAANGKD
jgi:hypothetical protein